MVGVEALARWTDPVVGPVLPTTFVPLAERTGLAEPLTELALEIAATDARRWLDDGFNIPVAVNVPAKVLLDPSFPDLVEAKRLAMGLDESALEIEITESTLMGDHDQAREALTRLRNIGVRTSIDDFGTGYSSLSYLRQLPVHALKIDRSFISDVSDEPGSDAIVRSIIELARNLRLETVAEGVEDERICEPARRARLRPRAGLRARPPDGGGGHEPLAARAGPYCRLTAMSYFQAVRIYSIVEVCIFTGLVVTAIGGFSDQAELILGWTHGFGWILLCLLVARGCAKKLFPWWLLGRHGLAARTGREHGRARVSGHVRHGP